MAEIPEFNVDPSAVAREVQKQERLAEAEALKMRVLDENVQRANRKAAVEAGLIDEERARQIRDEQEKENDLLQTQREINARQRMRGMVKTSDGNYKDYNGNTYDSRGNLIEDEGEWV